MIQYIVFLGAFVNLLGSLSYIRDILRGRVKPNRVSWLMWSIAPMIATAAGIASGAGWVVLPVFMSGFCPFLAFVASFFNSNAYWKLERFDYLCGFFSLIALILWAITKQPIVAIIFAIISDGVAGVPTLVKAWNYPETESYVPFLTGLINASTSFFAIKAVIFYEYAFPIYLILINSSLIFIITRKRFMEIFRSKVGNS